MESHKYFIVPMALPLETGHLASKESWADGRCMTFFPGAALEDVPATSIQSMLRLEIYLVGILCDC